MPDEHAFIDKHDYARTMREKDPETRAKMCHAYTTNRRNEKLTAGDVVPKTVLLDVDGRSKRNIRAKDHRPLVILLGAASCPPFRRAIGEFQEIREQYRSSTDFLIVYTEEPHPLDGWVPSGNLKDGVAIPQHRTIEERLAAAQRFANEYDVRVPIAVDTMDNAANGLFAAWPVRIYILDEKNRVYFRGGRGPYDFRLADARAALETLAGTAERG